MVFATSCSAELAERFAAIHQARERLSTHTTLRIGGEARHFLMPRRAREAAELFAYLGAAGVPTFLLGGGSNLLVRDEGFEGAVVHLGALRAVERKGERLRVGAGTPLALAVKLAQRMGLGGLEPLVGIPGTVGGAVYMNAGGRHGETADAIESIVVVDARGRTRKLAKDEVGFGYRRSQLHGQYVLEATFRLAPAPPQAICERMAELLKAKHRSQPMGQRSAGCVFKNPDPARAAAMLIDRAGLKGLAVGEARVSARHANFIVNEGEARAADVLHLIAQVRREVLIRHGTPLALEVQVLGREGLEAH